MKIVYTKMVADLFHKGHVHFLKNAKALGDKLVVHIVSDERVAKLKRAPVMNQQERIEVVTACKFVDEVLSDGPKIITPEFMVANDYSIYAYGATENEKAVKQGDCESLPPEMIRIIPYTEGISTTEIIERILQRND